MSNLTKKDELTINIQVTQDIEVKGKIGEAAMLLFGGSADCNNFKGAVLPGGVDTQKEIYGTNRVLSARYMLEGIDGAGEACRIFIENVGIIDESGRIEKTTPKIITDSKYLSYLETSILEGTIEFCDTAQDGIIIHIYIVD